MNFQPQNFQLYNKSLKDWSFEKQSILFPSGPVIKCLMFYRSVTSLPLRRFVFYIEAIAKREWHASHWRRSARDHGKDKNKRRGDVSPVFSFPPFSLSRLPLRPNFHGERDVWVRGRILTVPNSACKCKSATCCNFRGSCLLRIKLKLKNPGRSTKSALNLPRSVKSVKLNQ